jgi:flagellar FliL protein
MTARPSKTAKPPIPAPSLWRGTILKTVVATALTTLVLAGASLLIYRIYGPQKSATAKAAAQQKADPVVYYDFPKVIVELKASGARSVHSATLRVTAEFDDPSALIPSKAAQPRILDSMQTFLRDRSWEELQGRSGTDLLRNSMLQIVNASIAPHRANQVLFKQILIE